MLDGGAGVTRWLLEATEDEEDRVVRRRTFRAEDDGVTPWGVTAGVLRSRERGREGRRESALDAIGTKRIRCSRAQVQVLHRKGQLTTGAFRGPIMLRTMSTESHYGIYRRTNLHSA